MTSFRPAPLASPCTGLLLTGGGARAAYQVGVLEGIAELRRAAGVAARANPFPIVTGTSAGAINAAALACGVDDFDAAVRRIGAVWRQVQAQHIYRTESMALVPVGDSWRGLISMGRAVAAWRRLRPRSLFDNAPLRALLTDAVPFERLPRLIRQGQLRALGIAASSYGSGEHVTFFQGHPEVQPWVRSQRRALRARIGYEHLLASSAIPLLFPASALEIDGHTEYFGDGSMRQSAPVAAAIHLGADRVLVVGAGRLNEPAAERAARADTHYPSMAEMAGHLLSSIFLDTLATDIERLQRINQTLKLIPADARAASPLRPIELLTISPSVRIDTIAARHMRALPTTVRALLGNIGMTTRGADPHGGVLASYLLFEPAYIEELIALGRADTLRQRAEVCAFFGWRAGAGPGRTVFGFA